MPSYDQIQRAAELRTCATCKQEFYCTKADSLPVPFICAGCKK